MALLSVPLMICWQSRDCGLIQPWWEPTCELKPSGISASCRERETGLSFFAVSLYQGNCAYLNEATAPPTPVQDKPPLRRQTKLASADLQHSLVQFFFCCCRNAKYIDLCSHSPSHSISVPTLLLPQWEAGQLPHPLMMQRSETSPFLFYSIPPYHSVSYEYILFTRPVIVCFSYCASRLNVLFRRH